jgi:methionine sulfoxide reductase heme-binding subunit
LPASTDAGWRQGLRDRMQGVNEALRRVPVWLVYVSGMAPAVWLFWLGLTGGLGPDPVKVLEHRLGEIGLQFLVAVLAVSPLRWATGLSLLRFRRALGLLAFAYVALHVSVWLLLDQQLNWAEIWDDLTKRPYIMIGMLGFAVMVPLAATSNAAALRRMGAVAWQQLHRLVYLAAVAGVIHYLLLVKTWRVEPVLYLVAILLLLGLRLPRIRRHLARRR